MTIEINDDQLELLNNLIRDYLHNKSEDISGEVYNDINELLNYFEETQHKIEKREDERIFEQEIFSIIKKYQREHP